MTCNFYCLVYFLTFETLYFNNLCWTHILMIRLLRLRGPKMESYSRLLRGTDFGSLTPTTLDILFR
jgi:hypothetical protein